MTLQTECVAFHGDQVLTVKKDDKVFVAVKPISDALGLNWVGQYKKLTERAKTPIVDNYNPLVRRYDSELVPVPVGHQIQEMLCIPLEKMNGWLFSIHPDRVKPEVRAKVVAYQEECFAALFQYWHHGAAVRGEQGVAAPPPPQKPPLSPDEVRGAVMGAISDRIRFAVRELAEDAVTEWRKAVCRYFAVSRPEEIRPEDLDTALEFIESVPAMVLVRRAMLDVLKDESGWYDTEDEGLYISLWCSAYARRKRIGGCPPAREAKLIKEMREAALAAGKGGAA
jgi:hypothetical protein